MCGADDPRDVRLTLNGGSSPRVRSRQTFPPIGVGVERIISACAEQTTD